MSEIMEFKCPACGGPVVFDAQSQMMKCTYCGTSYDQSILEQYDAAMKNLSTEDDYSWQVQTNEEWTSEETANLSVYVCQSCAGQIVAEPQTIATHCPYCDNPIVVAGQVAGDLKPSYIIPFQTSRDEAIANLFKHLEGKKLLPALFKDENRIQKIRGMYVPFWVFDAKVTADMNYRASNVRSWSDSIYSYKETSYFSLFRNGQIDFEKVPVDASSKISDVLMQSIEPFDMQKAVPFNVGYLSGYLADRYDVEADQCISIANQRIEESTKQKMASTVAGYSSVIPQSSSVKIGESLASYVLFPVWFLNTIYEEKDYTFIMNGQTGRFVGDLPVDKKLATSYFLKIMLGLFIILYGIAWLVHLLF